MIFGTLSVAVLLGFFELVPSWNVMSDILYNRVFMRMSNLHMKYFVEVGFIEELAKLGAFCLIEFGRRKLFKNTDDSPLATMVYVGMVSLGFAGVENILYAMSAQSASSTIMWRSMTAVIGHLVFGLYMGYFIAKSRVLGMLENKSPIDSILTRYPRIRTFLFGLFGLIAASILHGIYDLHLTLNGMNAISGVYIFLVTSLIGVFWCFKDIIKIISKK